MAELQMSKDLFCLLPLSADNSAMLLNSGAFLQKKEGLDSIKKDTVFIC